ncbi:MAG TPA: TetR/AcrR family transcriptional regulator [Acidimicrobiales bacterium]|nr:TetR/AcrR family transcriptional regulator [Acidimicrobiales bacterium]
MTALARPPGRPRDPGADRAILEAAIDVLREHGFGGFTVDAVAARAGVGKATIYRRWSGKEELILAAAETVVGDMPSPDTGSVRDDLLVLAGALAAHLTSEPAGCLAADLAAEATRNEEARTLIRRFTSTRRKVSAAVVRRAIERGELRPDIEPDAVVDAVVGPIFFRARLSGAPLTPKAVERIVDLALHGAVRR